MEFDYEKRIVLCISEDELQHWIAMLHGVLINCGAWDRLAEFDTETAQQLAIIAETICTCSPDLPTQKCDRYCKGECSPQ